MNIQSALSKFFEYSLCMKGYSIYTVEKFDFSINNFARYSNITDTDEITEKKVRDYFLYGRSTRKWSSATVLSRYNCLKVFFKWCIKDECMTKNYTEDLELPKLEQRIPEKLTKQDATKLLECVYNLNYQDPFLRHRNYAIFSMFLFAGLRRSELLKLKFADVDLENGSILIRQGKWHKDRIIPMTYKLIEILSRYLVERKKQNKTCPEFFASYTFNSGLSVGGIIHLVKDIRAKTKVKFGLHRLRHTFATLMLEGGCDIYSLSKMMGHSKISTTTIYLTATAEHLKSQITKHPLNNM